MKLTVVHHFFYDTDLFVLELLSGIGMVGINDGSRIFYIHFVVHF